MRAPFSLMLISDERPDLSARLQAALAGPWASRIAVQLRMKGATARATYERARELRTLTRERGAQLFINDRLDVALAVAADGVQLPAQGLPAAIARSLLPASMRIGVSCHDPRELLAAQQQGADFALLSPIYAVPGKGPPLALAQLAKLCAQAALPIVALGGLNAERLAGVRAAGAHGFAVIRAVLDSDDPGQAASILFSAWDQTPSS